MSVKLEKLKKLHHFYNYKLNHSYSIYKYFEIRYYFFTRLINCGEKFKAFGRLKNLNLILKLKQKKDPYFVLTLAAIKIMPLIYLKYRRQGFAHQLIPVPISYSKQVIFVLKWTMQLLKKQNRVVKISTLADLLLKALRGEGSSIKERNKMHNTASENRYLMRFLKKRKRLNRRNLKLRRESRVSIRLKQIRKRIAEKKWKQIQMRFSEKNKLKQKYVKKKYK